MLLRDRTKILETHLQLVQNWIKGKGKSGSEASERVAAVTISLPLKSLKKGAYTLQIHVRDIIADANLFERVPMVIEYPESEDEN